MAASILKAQAPAYTDISGLSKLKRAVGNDDPAAIRVVAEQFEAMFTRMMLKSMRDAVGPDPMFGSDQQQMYQSMADDQLSIQLAKGKGLGLADMLMRQLQKWGVKGAQGAAGTSHVTGAKAAAAYGATAEAAKTDFVQGLWPEAEQAGQLLGVDPRHLIAQAALETNWGRNMPLDANGRCTNNLFGIKASSGWTGATVTAVTQEFQAGAMANTSAQFRAYASPAQSFRDYVALLRNNPRYAAALNTGSDLQAFATGLQRGGYATDPDYAGKIAAIAATVANKVNSAGAPPQPVSDLKLSAAAPLTASTGTL